MDDGHGEYIMDVPVEYKCRVLSFRGFYPAGPIADGDPESRDSVRTHDLIQIYTDPGGLRTLRASHIVRVQ